LHGLVIASKIFLPGELHYIKVGLSDLQPLETMDACFIFFAFSSSRLSRLFANFGILHLFLYLPDMPVLCFPFVFS